MSPAIETYCKTENPKRFAKLLEMGSADKVSYMNTMHRAHVMTGLAAITFSIINCCNIIHKSYCAIRAALYTLAASYTTVLADLANIRALVMVVTLYNHC